MIAALSHRDGVVALLKFVTRKGPPMFWLIERAISNTSRIHGTLCSSSDYNATPRAKRGRLRATVSSPKMIKSIAALTIFGLLGAAVVALPDFGPQVGARETITSAEEDRSSIRPIAQNCLRQVWPNFDTSCLRNGASGATVLEARLATARR
jgi:hypothetical protein